MHNLSNITLHHSSALESHILYAPSCTRHLPPSPLTSMIFPISLILLNNSTVSSNTPARNLEVTFDSPKLFCVLHLDFSSKSFCHVKLFQASNPELRSHLSQEAFPHRHYLCPQALLVSRQTCIMLSVGEGVSLQLKILQR